MVILASNSNSYDQSEKEKSETAKEDKSKVEVKHTEKQKTPQTITYTVISPTGEILYNNLATISEPMTIQDMIIKTGLPITIEEKSTNLLTSINGFKNYTLSESVYGGWIFEVNGKWCNQAMNQYIMQPNDVITWKYLGTPLELLQMDEENNLTMVGEDIPTDEMSKGGKSR